jgi:hypothetical protein
LGDLGKFAEEGKNELFWNSIYKKAFPNMINHMRGGLKKCNSQDKGVDRIIYLDNLKVITIDEKIRREEWKDILLEYLSNDRKNTPGWMEKDLAIDYIAYAFLVPQIVYLFDWRILKLAWDKNKLLWQKTYGTKTAPNQGYNTLSIPVPIDILLKSCSETSIIKL